MDEYVQTATNHVLHGDENGNDVGEKEEAHIDINLHRLERNLDERCSDLGLS